MKTELLYKTDPRVCTCDAVVLSTRIDANQTLVILDRTPFYPEGGGQPSDTGFLGDYVVTGVFEKDGEIVHCIDGSIEISAGTKVSLAINQDRRRDHTQQHSGQHLLSANLLRIKNAPTRSFHLGAEYSTVDIDIPSLENEDVAYVEAEVNRMIADDYAYKKYVCSYDEAVTLPLRRQPPQGEAEIRIIEIDGFDFTPCCGTHVDHALEIQLLKIIRYEKYKGMTRVYFVAGLRAYTYLAKLYSNMETLAKNFGTNVENLVGTVLGAKEKLEKAETEVMYWKHNAIQKTVEALCAKQQSDQFLVYRTDEDFDYAMKLSKALAEAGTASCIVSTSNLRIAVAIPKDKPFDLAASIQSTFGQRKFRGGGGKNFFQLSGDTNEELDEILSVLGRISLA